MAATISGCTVKKQEAPTPTGPSELGTSISVQANPDVLSQDGASQSQIVITARDANGQPLRNVPVRAEITVNGIVVDFGRLSARTVVTGSDGRAFVTYTAPAPPPEPVDNFTIVRLIVVPSGTDFSNAVARGVEIRLVPPGVILPPNGTPLPAFTFSQPAQENTPVQFDGSGSKDDGQIVSYAWDFGDSTTGTGVRPTHTYALGGTYNVTLTVTDDRGLRASTTQPVTVGTVVNPTATFSASPTVPAVGEEVFFNASASQAAPGRTIVSYQWTFGDGDTGSGVFESHDYSAVGSYNVVLTVTDDAGKTGTNAVLLTVGPGQKPTASFVSSPGNPRVGQTVNFNAAASTAPPGRTISSYRWDFGDGSTGSGLATSHAYSRAANYVVTLVVIDSTGAQGTSTGTVTVSSNPNPTGPTADFTFSPGSPTTSTTVQFNASSSTPGSEGTIVSYAWDFGDPSGIPPNTATAVTTTHKFNSVNSFTVTLTVTDSNGRTGTVNKVVDVQ